MKNNNNSLTPLLDSKLSKLTSLDDTQEKFTIGDTIMALLFWLGVLIGLVLLSIHVLDIFFAENKANFQSPIIIQTPVFFTPRGTSTPNMSNVGTVSAISWNIGHRVLDLTHLETKHAKAQIITPKPVQTNDKVEEIICEVFGKDCRMALAVSQAENGTRVCDRAGSVNRNGTRDWGVFQINEIHFNKDFTLEDAKDCRKNIEKAFQIFKSWGSWKPWSAFNNGSFKKFLR